MPKSTVILSFNNRAVNLLSGNRVFVVVGKDITGWISLKLTLRLGGGLMVGSAFGIDGHFTPLDLTD